MRDPIFPSRHVRGETLAVSSLTYKGAAGVKVVGNVASWDRALRVVLGISLLWLAWISVEGPVATGLTSVGAIFLVTGLVGGCPLYAILGLDSRNPRRR